MALYKLIALTNAVAGHEDDFNRWYDAFHLPETCAVPGVIGGQRFRRVGTPKPNGDTPRYEYLVIYDIETDEPERTIALLREYIETGRIGRNPELMAQPSWTAVFVPLAFEERAGPKIQAGQK
jgi:hypothetical protein